MLNKKTTSDYVAKLAKQYGLPKKTVHKILHYGMKNMCLMILDGQEIELQHFGVIYFDKESYAKYCRKVNEEYEKKRNNQSGNSTRT